ncbi:MAG: helix-turn-helix domain-containing protein [Dehalobacterium sp.]
MVEKIAISVPEVAKALGISRNLAYCLIREGKLPALKLGERRLVVPVKALEEFMLIETPESYGSK